MIVHRTTKILTRMGVMIACIALQACTISYNTVAGFDDYAGVFEGVVTVASGGTGSINLHEVGGDITCSGISQLYTRPSGLYKRGGRGDAVIECSDGRLVEARWIQSKEDGGTGSGKDQHGNLLHFKYDVEQAVLENYKKTILAAAKKKEDLPPIYKPKETRKEKGYSTGTGFFISKNGHFITNYHVVEDSNDITIILEDGHEHPASIIASDPANDIVIGQISADQIFINTPQINISGGNQMDRGDEVLVLGYPLISIQGQQQKATFGRVNSLAGIQDDVRFYQVDAPIQPGNSGGPLLNTRGEVVGVVTATLNQITALKLTGSLPQNVNYAVKTDYILPLIRSKFPELESQGVSLRTPMAMAKIVKDIEDAVFLIIAR